MCILHFKAVEKLKKIQGQAEKSTKELQCKACKERLKNLCIFSFMVVFKYFKDYYEEGRDFFGNRGQDTRHCL